MVYLKSVWPGTLRRRPRRSVLKPCSTLMAIFLALSPLTNAISQLATPAFESISTIQGLADNYILCMMQDSHGFMWFGTRDGLNKYDGYAFTTFKHRLNDPHSISDGGIDCIAEDGDGDIWVGTSAGGLNRLDHISGRFDRCSYDPRHSHGIVGNRVLSLCTDADGDVWTVTDNTDGTHVLRFDRTRESFVDYRYDPSDPHAAPSSLVTSIRCSPDGDVWIGTQDRGIWRYDPTTDRFIGTLSASDSRTRNPGSSTLLGIDNQGYLWYLGSMTGVFRIPVRNGSLVTPAARRYLTEEYVTSMFEDRSGTLWFGTAFDGLQMIDEHTGSHQQFRYDMTNPTGLQSNRIFCLTQDRAGNLWVGTDNGIDKLNMRAWYFRHYRHDPLNPSSLSHGYVRSVLKDPDGNLWVGTGGGGLNVLAEEANAFRHYDLSLPGYSFVDCNTVNTICRDHEGVLWLGTNTSLVRMTPWNGRKKFYPIDPANPHSIGASGIWAILEDHDNDLWVGTLKDGISRHIKGSDRFIHYRHDPLDTNSLGNNTIHCLYEDSHGRLWVGTDNGVDRFDKSSGRWTHYRHDPESSTSISHNRVWYICETRDGNLWIGTSGGGIDKFVDGSGTFIRYTETEGLANNIVCGIVEDNHGFLWISTNNGLSKFDPATSTFKNYNAGDGLPVHEFHFKACCRDSSGTIFLGGRNGLVEFYPDSIRDNTVSPPLAITGLKVFGKTLPLDTTAVLKRSVHLDHGDNFFSIEFTALDFTNPSRNRYRYKLEGIDVDWHTSQGTGRPYADYTDIPPGHYQFLLQGSNSDGFWNTEGALLEIIISPAYWQTLWFKGAVGLILVSGLGGVLFLRIRTIRRQGELEHKVLESQLRALRAQMNPHFIFNSLNSILHFIITRDGASAYKYLSTFSRLIRSILENSQRDYISVAEELEWLRLYLDLESLRYDHRFAYRFEIDSAIETDLMEIPPMLIQPYVENAVKHGLAYRNSGGDLLIRLNRSEGHILCSVVDNGIGRTESASLKGRHAGQFKSVGMTVTRERLEMLNGALNGHHSVQITDLYDERQQACGTRVDIRIPLL